MSFADVNGVHLYYEEHGSGEQTLVLLHGGFGATEMMAGIMPALSAGRRVIAVDLQGHGRTADIDRPLRYESMAEDIAALIRQLGVGAVDVMGYSVGGGVAARTAIQHPGVVRRLVLVSIPCRRSAWFPEVLAGMGQLGAGTAEPMKQSPLWELYSRLAPRVEDWPILHAKMGDLHSVDYDWTEEVATLEMPVMLVVGDNDSFPPAHAAEFYALLGGGLRDAGWDNSGRVTNRLAILPGGTHYDMVAQPELARVTVAFLDEKLS